MCFSTSMYCDIIALHTYVCVHVCVLLCDILLCINVHVYTIQGASFELIILTIYGDGIMDKVLLVS